MLVPKPEQSGIIVRNFLTVFVVVSLMIYIHMGLNQATNSLNDTNGIVKSMLNNETYTISQQRLYNLQKSLQEKSYHHLSSTQCLVKIYLDVLNNQIFIDNDHNSKDQNSPQSVKSNSNQKVELKFTELVFPTISHSLQGFRNCSDILTVMNFLNPAKTDFIYTKFMQEKYGSFIHDSQPQSKPIEPQISTNFCIFTNQFNTSTTKLRQNINSVINQSYENYHLIVLDNASTDGSYEIAKVILTDLKNKLISETPQDQKPIEDRYQIIKEDKSLGIWDLYSKHQSQCKNSDFVLFLDGRDSFPTRHTLSILNHFILNFKNSKPSMVTAPMLQKRELTRWNPLDFSTPIKESAIPTYTFKILSTELLRDVKNQLKQATVNLTHSFEVEKTTIEVLSKYMTENHKSSLQIDEISYVYDTLENKQTQRNQYFVAVVRKELNSKKKDSKKSEKVQSLQKKGENTQKK